jgi:hypothetical protein
MRLARLYVGNGWISIEKLDEWKLCTFASLREKGRVKLEKNVS